MQIYFGVGGRIPGLLPDDDIFDDSGIKLLTVYDRLNEFLDNLSGSDRILLLDGSICIKVISEQSGFGSSLRETGIDVFRENIENQVFLFGRIGGQSFIDTLTVNEPFAKQIEGKSYSDLFNEKEAAGVQVIFNVEKQVLKISNPECM